MSDALGNDFYSRGTATSKAKRVNLKSLLSDSYVVSRFLFTILEVKESFKLVRAIKVENTWR